MPDLELRFDPRRWSAVPPESEAPGWFAGLLAVHDEAHHPALAMAAALAVDLGMQSDLSALLLFTMPEAECYGALSVLQLADVQIPSDAAAAAQIAQAVAPSEWESATTTFEADGIVGWRISQASVTRTGSGQPSQSAELDEVTLVWVLDVSGRLCIARMTPLPPLSAALLLPEIEGVLSSARLISERAA